MAKDSLDESERLLIANPKKVNIPPVEIRC
ncbi:hypothetical protein SNOG_12353 [Parastagonospora nodorum SN15]|uniref:Uncharacterized protein n=1 Tax=Phaeosphaeria nodorum (strain SN15 / ATCC MYA-4574 / FGSC 10173) TaxID=321614 RepID=Q0U7B1_PHANO|nr:hypothetical protein SNOG_12353 [Parastagonospora nodorum SN15]EAT80166.1 hypothetical protein SNOG_12353 [Parastagonospora nodorum SN15]